MIRSEIRLEDYKGFAKKGYFSLFWDDVQFWNFRVPFPDYHFYDFHPWGLSWGIQVNFDCFVALYVCVCECAEEGGKSEQMCF